LLITIDSGLIGILDVSLARSLSQGSIFRVTSLSQKWRRKNCYKRTFNNGSAAVCMLSQVGRLPIVLQQD